MRFYEGISVFNFSWEEVAQGLWQRYPNPESSHVLSEDTVIRKVINNSLHTKRFLTKTNRLPKWGERFVQVRNVNIIEESIIDPSKKEISTYTRNVGLTKVMSCVEKVTYTPHPADPSSTIAKRQAWIDSQIFGFGYAIQKFGVDRYRKNVSRTDNGFLYVLNRLFPLHDGKSNTTSLDHNLTLDEKKQRLKDAARETAKRAKQLAQEKTMPIYASCDSS